MLNPLQPQLRLAELLASFSLALDLGTGQPLEWVLRCCLLGAKFSETLGLNAQERRNVYYLSLLRHIGCTATATMEADLFGNELMLGEGLLTDSKDLSQAFSFLWRNTGKGYPLTQRARFLGKALAAGPASKDELDKAQCEVALQMASTLGFTPEIRQALAQVYERWDGQGVPHRLKGDALTLAVRVVQLAQDMVTFQMVAGPEATMNVARQRANHLYDPALVNVFLRHARELFMQLETPALWDAVLDAEPNEPWLVSTDQLEAALFAIADFADLKSPYLVGHSRGVAALAARAAEQCGLHAADVLIVRRAGLVHDLGRVGVSAALWNKTGALTEGEWERVRLHPNYTERVLARSKALAELGALAALHHERLDGSGYHRRLPAHMLPMTARLLAAADVYHAMGEARPHRPAWAMHDAVNELRRAVIAGQLDAQAVEAVLGAAGHRASLPRKEPTMTLTERERQVLRLIARGHSNKQIAKHLSISNKTADNHTQNIYQKIGVSTRAAATLFAVQNNLLAE